MTNTTAIRHPYEAGQRPRKLYLVSQALTVGATATILVGVGFLLRAPMDDWAYAPLAVGAVLWLAGEWVGHRAWWSVAWRDQKSDAVPAWITTISRGGQLALVIATITYGVALHTAWSSFLAVLLSGGLAGALIVRAIRGRRASLAPRWRTWRVIDATALTLATAAVVTFLAHDLNATDRGWVFVVVAYALVAAIMGAGMAGIGAASRRENGSSS